MQTRLMLSMLGLAVTAGPLLAAPAKPPHLNPVIDLLAKGQPVMGLYAPGNRRLPGQEAPPAPKTPAQLVEETKSYKTSDFVFDGSMEYHFDQTFPVFAAFATALREAGATTREPYPHLAFPMYTKIPEIAPDPAAAKDHIHQQLNLGVSGVMFVGVESAEEVKQGLAAMRFKSKGGNRPDDVGQAPAFWGVSEKEYRQKADVWPLNPRGELVTWVVVESLEGLKHVREIAAVKGVGVLWPGAGTLRADVFTSTGPDGKKVFDQAGWENAIQTVLAACKEFHVACGFPAKAEDIEMRMSQGFSVFVSGWGENGFKAVELARKAGKRDGNAG